MSDQYSRMLPAQIVQDVEFWVDTQHDDAVKWDNRELLDESSVFTLHMLAAKIYAAGYDDGSRGEAERNRGVRRRKTDARRREAEQQDDGAA